MFLEDEGRRGAPSPPSPHTYSCTHKFACESVIFSSSICIACVHVETLCNKMLKMKRFKFLSEILELIFAGKAARQIL